MRESYNENTLVFEVILRSKTRYNYRYINLLKR